MNEKNNTKKIWFIYLFMNAIILFKKRKIQEKFSAQLIYLNNQSLEKHQYQLPTELKEHLPLFALQRKDNQNKTASK
jgi:hypothetical protein